MKTVPFKQLSPIYQNLLKEAAKVMENAYSPYSHFFVGSAVLTKNGSVISGCNMENATYNITICGERSAITAAVSQGKKKFKAISVIGRGTGFDSEEVISPCGVCRQVIFEFSQVSGVDIEVIMSNTKMSKIVIAKISELLPLAFGPKDLGISVEQY